MRCHVAWILRERNCADQDRLDRGTIYLRGLPTGTVQLMIRRIGYRSVSVGLVAKPDTRGVSIAAKMTPNETTLGTVVIEGKKVDLALFQNGFYTRQKNADGYFFPPERLEKTAAALSTMMNEIPSVKVAHLRGRNKDAGRVNLSPSPQPSKLTYLPERWPRG